ncbi:ATP-NAD kinase-like domain-containing protein [Obelidium mucronatum]|nr:ATP-NAD kinase-like domain-containing protein [Obelidium mucronatum]
MEWTAATAAATTLAAACIAVLVLRWTLGRADALQPQIARIAGQRHGAHVWQSQKILVLVNPFGGGRKGKKVWETLVEPTLKTLKIEYDLVLTARPHHARSLMIEGDLDQYAGIMILSGDGMLHEVINGLYVRVGKDMDALKSFALCIIPTGTCNGFAASLSSSSPTDCLKSFAACTKLHAVDLYSVKSLNKEKILDIHCVSTGCVADFDDYVERVFRTNPFRMLLAPLMVIGQAKSYRGKLYIKPAATLTEEETRFAWRNGFDLPPDDRNRKDWRLIDSEFFLMTVINTDRASHDMYFVPGAKVDDGNLYVLVGRKGVSRWTLIQCFLAFEDGSHTKFKEFEIYKATAVEYQPMTQDGSMTVSGEPLPVVDTRVDVLPRAIHFAH